VDRLPTAVGLPHDQCASLLWRLLLLVALLDENGAPNGDGVAALVLGVRLALRIGACQAVWPVCCC
jgi:hypothetical protein